MIKFAAAAALSAMLLTAAAPAIAGSDVAVPYGDLNLASTEGVETLDSRLVRASKVACGELTGPLDAGKRSALARCRAGALEGARGKAKTVVAQANSTQRLASK